ncbi:sensor histidine kinase [Amycolatopsis sp. NPDC058986]|uniref:sensor histidine kinase n=1 Tax=unclassified Amycolatopsis TaxID=2618356 RepID=UPI00366C90F8
MLGERVDSWMRGHVLSADAVAALVLAGSSVLLGLQIGAESGYFVLSLLLTVPLALRRRAPVLCAALVSAAAFAQWLTVRDSIGALPADVAVPIAVHAAVAHGPVWAGRLATAAGLLGAALGGWSWPQLPVPVSLHVVLGALLGSTVVAAWAVGVLHRVRRRQLDMLAERARLLEVERDQRARLAVLGERTRIAREMHDVVAHSLAVVIAQADGGRYAAASSPEAGRSALETIGEHARQALGEVRRVLGVLRNDSGESVAPQPGAADVRALVDRVRAGGLDVRLSMDLPAPVEPALGLVVYRIVQEGLTNVLKHAGRGARAEVSLRWEDGGLAVDVRDEGGTPLAAAGPGGGYGLAGMRERAGAHGGTVTFGRRPGGGHVLSARIPVPS